MSNDIMRSQQRACGIGEHTRPACGSLRPRDDELLWEVGEGGTPSPTPETGAFPSNVNAAGRMPALPTARMAALLDRKEKSGDSLENFLL